MDIKSILKTVGTAALSLTPFGAAAIPVINALLPDDKKLPPGATGVDAQCIIEQLPPSERSKIEVAQIELEVEKEKGFTNRFEAMAQVDSTGHTTRPAIAIMMARVVCFAVIVIISMFAYAVAVGNEQMIKAIVDGWPFLLALLGTPTALLRAYFAMRTKEKQHKYHAASGVESPVGLVTSLLRTFKK